MQKDILKVSKFMITMIGQILEGTFLVRNEQKGDLKPLNFLFIQIRGHLLGEK